MPKVSVVMPVYNVAQYLEECLNSVLRQSLTDIEVICVDDGSTDGSAAILDEYARKDSRVRVIHNSNNGYGKSMNIGISMSRGEYIGVVETDDYIATEMMQELYCCAKKCNLDVVKGDYYIFKDTDGKRQFEYVNIISDEELYGKIIEPLNEKKIFKARINTWAGIYKRSFLEDNNILHNETPGASYQDNGFWFQVFSQAKSVMLINKPYYYLRRDNPDSSINSKGKVYCVCDEMDFILRFMLYKPEVYANFKEIYWEACIRKYIFNLKRIGTHYKKDFIQYMSEEFNSTKFEDIDFSIFTDKQKEIFSMIKNTPETFWQECVYIPDKFVKYTMNNKKEFVILGRGATVYNLYRKCRYNNMNVLTVANFEENNVNTKGIIPVVNIRELQDKAHLISILVVDRPEKYHGISKRLEEMGFYDYMYYEDV